MEENPPICAEEEMLEIYLQKDVLQREQLTVSDCQPHRAVCEI
jgi:hypothetical protein